MVEDTVEVALEVGLQARPAAQFVQEANRFSSNIFLEKNSKRINAKSIMGLMSLAVSNGETISVIADGEDATEAVEHLTAFIRKTTI